MKTLFLRRSVFAIFSAVLLISACGGGGGEPAAGQTNPNPPTTGGGSTTPVPTVPVVVSGTVRYDRVAVNPTSGALNYNSIRELPVRGATVDLVSTTGTIATTQTNASGQFSFTSAPGSTTLAIRVRAELKQTVGSASWDVTVRDNTNAEALYTLQSNNFNSGAGSTQNLKAGSGWGGLSYTSARVAGPFAILDTIYESQQKILAAQPNAQFPTLKAFWSVNNNTTGGGQLQDGDIGTSFFTEISNAGVITERRLYILGRENDDTDEYDDSVIAHEWGHYYQSAFSRDDSMGGTHGGRDDRLDRRIAFSEGWGNAWSGISLAKNTYSDSSGNAQARGFVLALDSGYTSATGAPKGWFREQSIQYILWSLSNQAGLPRIHQALTSDAFRTGVALTDIHSFSAAYRSIASTTQTAALNGLLASESISNASDAFGNLEANSGGNPVTLPYYRQITALGSPVTLASGQTLCGTADNVVVRNSANAADADRNKLGLFVYVRFNLTAAASRTISITASQALGADVDFELYRGAQRVYVAEVGTNQTESRMAVLGAGDYVLVIYDYNKASPGNTCYTVSIQ